MVYVLSDLHGCYDKYIRMLEKINFGKNDVLYVLGDVIDRGDDGIEILSDMMKRVNVVPLLGNHEYMAYKVLNNMNVEITEENYDSQVDMFSLRAYENWMHNGGLPTSKKFTLLAQVKREAILDYISGFDVYCEIEVDDNRFLLVHGGLGTYEPEKDAESCSLHELVWSRCDYDKQYYKDKYLVTGHTPTCLISEEYDGKIYRAHNHIAIDCGAVFGRPLGCICLNTFEEFYVE